MQAFELQCMLRAAYTSVCTLASIAATFVPTVGNDITSGGRGCGKSGGCGWSELGHVPNCSPIWTLSSSLHVALEILNTT